MSMPPTNQNIYSPQGLPDPQGPGPNDDMDAYYEFEAFQMERAYRKPDLPPATWAEFLRYKQWKQHVATHPAIPPLPPPPAYMQAQPTYMPSQPVPNTQQPPPPPPNPPPRRRRTRAEAADTADSDAGELADAEAEVSGEEEDPDRPPKAKRYKSDCPLTAKGVKLNKQQLAVKNQLKVRIYLLVGRAVA